MSNKMQRYTVYFIWKLLYMFRVVPPPNIRSANNCIYSIWYLSHRYCSLPLSRKSWNWFECAVGGLIKLCERYKIETAPTKLERNFKNFINIISVNSMKLIQNIWLRFVISTPPAQTYQVNLQKWFKLRIN